MTTKPETQEKLLRLSKLMSERGICSRREADEYISKGYVFVNGIKISELGTKVSPDVEIRLSEVAKASQEQLVTVLLNKPIGFVSSQPEDGYEPAIVLLTAENYYSEEGSEKSSAKPPQNLNPRRLDNLAVTGRLDIDSKGLLIFTQDGRIAKHLISKDTEVEKEYLVRVEGKLSDSQLALLRHGLVLDDKKLKPAKVEWINNDQLQFIIHEGRKRQIRRMCEAVGLRVTGLKRVRIGNVKLGHLPEGKWRFLKPDEKF